MKNVKQYYKELGRLVYCIAIADGVVQSEERDELHQFVKKELAHHEFTYDSSGMNQAFYVDFEFEDLAEKHIKTDGIADHFKNFVKNNIEPGDAELIRHSLNLMERVANAYSKNEEKKIIEHIKSITNVYLNKNE